MNQITVEKGRLQSMLRDNLAKHKAEHAVAMQGWRELVTEELQRMSALMAEKGVLELTKLYSYTRPESHAEDYEVALEMLAWHGPENVAMDQEAFRNYVQDNWQWKQNWRVSNTEYLEKAGRR